MSSPQRQETRWQKLTQNSTSWLFAILLVVGMTLVLTFSPSGFGSIAVKVGEPASRDIFAPRAITYTSDVETDFAHDKASSGVETIYTPFDLGIGRTQLIRARAVFAFVEVVRADTQATNDIKLHYIQAIDGLVIDKEVGTNLITLSQTDYETARQEVLSIIDELMRQEIRLEQLTNFQRSARRPSLVLSPSQESIVTNLAPQFIAANMFPDIAATEAKRAEAIANVEPSIRSIAKNQRIIRAGDIVTPLDVEVLSQLGLLQESLDWHDVASILLASILNVSILMLYWRQFHYRLKESKRYLIALTVLFLFFLAFAKLIIAPPSLLAYAFPAAALSMLMAVIFDLRFSLLTTILMAALIGFIGQNSLELTVYTAVGGIMAILTLRDAQQINAFFRAGIATALGQIVVIFIFRLPQSIDDPEIWQILLYALINGVFSSALTLVGFFVMGTLFGVTTTLQLQELSRLDHPLLRDLLRRAPGTYHHSIMVANLAEQAAEHVRANSTLVRVGAFYHDVGKMNRPAYFTENQEGINPHDTLDPYTSVRIIISHVDDGLALAAQYRLPDRIKDFIAEHHGTRLLKGFYLKAREQAVEEPDSVDREQFRYHGRLPSSRESGIVMLADAIEATSSALRPNTEKEIERLVNSIIDNDLTEGELDDSGLTLGDIKLIRSSFIETLKGRFHVRVRYPGNEQLGIDNQPPLSLPSPVEPIRVTAVAQPVTSPAPTKSEPTTSPSAAYPPEEK